MAVRLMGKAQRLRPHGPGDILLRKISISTDVGAVQTAPVPPNSLLALVGIQPRSGGGLQGSEIYRDCFRVSLPAHEVPVLTASSRSSANNSEAKANAAAMEYARAVFQSSAFAAERLLTVDAKALRTTDFADGYKVGRYQVGQRAPGEILFNWALPGLNMPCALWLAVRLPQDTSALPSKSGRTPQGKARAVADGATVPESIMADGGNATGEVELLFGSAAWELDEEGKGKGKPKPQEVFAGPIGSFHRWYSQLLLTSAAARLRTQKP